MDRLTQIVKHRTVGFMATLSSRHLAAMGAFCAGSSRLAIPNCAPAPHRLTNDLSNRRVAATVVPNEGLSPVRDVQ